MRQLVLICGLLSCCCPSQPHASISSYSVMSTHCINESMSVWRKPHPATSLLDCFASSRSFGLHSIGVVQRNRRDASCALFRFGQVCQLLSLINLTTTSPHQLTNINMTGPIDCETVVDSEYDAITANEHFAAVWVGDRGPTLENVVCGSEGQRNLMRSSGVSWTSEGASMDGVTSRLWVNETEGLNFTNSYTWVLHLKRTPGINCFIELTDCANLNTVKDQFFEYSSISSISRALYLYPGGSSVFQTGSVLPSDPEQFFVAGVAFDRLATNSKFFYGSSFLTDAPITSSASSQYTQAGACVKIGWRFVGNSMLNGVIKAVAISNVALSEDAIRRLFRV